MDMRGGEEQMVEVVEAKVEAEAEVEVEVESEVEEGGGGGGGPPCRREVTTAVRRGRHGTAYARRENATVPKPHTVQ